MCDVRCAMCDVRLCVAVALMAAAAMLAGCSTYQLRGKVVQGTISSVRVVDEHDPQLDRPGIGDATVQVTIDPATLARERLDPRAVDRDGSFSVPIDKVGAGVLEYQVQVVGRASGYQTAEHILPLPGGDKRLLITLSPGEDTYKAPTDFLEETLEMSEPYLRQ